MTGEMKLEDRGRKLNWKEACAILGCGKRQFYSLVKTGKLRGFRIVGCKRGLWVWENEVRKLVRPVHQA